MTYLESQGMRIYGAPRFSYVDGPWNQDDPCELQPDYVVLTLPVGKAKTHQENPSRKPIKKTHQENPSRNSKMSSKVEAKIKLILEFCSEPKSFIEIMVCGGCRQLLLSAISGSFASVIDIIRGCLWR